jgi:hypothetical protein
MNDNENISTPAPEFMKCPVCGEQVTKSHVWSREIKNPICANEYYIHYIDFSGAHTLIKHPEDKIEATNKRFMDPCPVCRVKGSHKLSCPNNEYKQLKFNLEIL